MPAAGAYQFIIPVGIILLDLLIINGINNYRAVGTDADGVPSLKHHILPPYGISSRVRQYLIVELKLAHIINTACFRQARSMRILVRIVMKAGIGFEPIQENKKENHQRFKNKTYYA